MLSGADLIPTIEEDGILNCVLFGIMVAVAVILYWPIVKPYTWVRDKFVRIKE